MNYSRQRELILKTIKKSKNHPSAYEIYDELKPDNPSLSLGTVYRNLKLLSTEKKILRLTSPNGPDRFDGCTDEHYHYYCVRCGKVRDADDIEASDIRDIIGTPKYQVIGYELNIFCICDECKEKESQEQIKDAAEKE